jgi:hypothetical protein
MNIRISARKQLKQVNALRILKEIDRHCDSFNRMGTLLDTYPLLEREHFFKALGWHWSCSDNIWEHKDQLSQILGNASRKELDLMMEPDELATLAKMPATIKIYRGCYENNQDGLSWTTDRAIAERFTTLHRYSRPNEAPLLLEDSIDSGRAVLKLERDEWEIIKYW